MQNAGRKEASVQGVVQEALPGTNFKVQLSDGRDVIAYLGGKMRLHRIRVLVGDNVDVQLDDYGKRGRIVKRL